MSDLRGKRLADSSHTHTHTHTHTTTTTPRYLGLLENVKVRRAGFAYRAEFPRFFDRFKYLRWVTGWLGGWVRVRVRVTGWLGLG